MSAPIAFRGITLRGWAAAAYYRLRSVVVTPAHADERCIDGGPVAAFVHCPRTAEPGTLWCKRHAPVWLCPCWGPCPRCGWADDDPGHEHPLDGDAVCLNCEPLWSSCWWVHIGPHIDGRCPQSAAEAWAWSDYDNAVASGEIAHGASQ